MGAQERKEDELINENLGFQKEKQERQRERHRDRHRETKTRGRD